MQSSSHNNVEPTARGEELVAWKVRIHPFQSFSGLFAVRVTVSSVSFGNFPSLKQSLFATTMSPLQSSLDACTKRKDLCVRITVVSVLYQLCPYDLLYLRDKDKSLRGQSVLWRTVIGLSLIRGSTSLDVSKLVFSKKRGKREKERKPLEKIQWHENW